MTQPAAVVAESPRAAVARAVIDGARFSLQGSAMNVLATVIACYGLLANSPAVVIGAMIVAVLLSPIMGVSLGLAESSHGVIARSLLSLLVGVLVVMTTALLLGWVHSDEPITAEMTARTHVGLFDLMVALAGGAAGAYATVSPNMNSGLVGVAVATALVPPLSTCALLLARGALQPAFGALSLAATNMVAIHFAGSVVMWLVGYRGITKISRRLGSFLVRDAPSILAVLALGAVFSVDLRVTVADALFRSEVRHTVANAVGTWPGAYLVELRFDTEPDGHVLIRAVTRAPAPPSALEVRVLEARVQAQAPRRPLELRVRNVETVIVNRDGVMFSSQAQSEDM